MRVRALRMQGDMIAAFIRQYSATVGLPEIGSIHVDGPRGRMANPMKEQRSPASIMQDSASGVQQPRDVLGRGSTLARRR